MYYFCSYVKYNVIIKSHVGLTIVRVIGLNVNSVNYLLQNRFRYAWSYKILRNNLLGTNNKFENRCIAVRDIYFYNITKRSFFLIVKLLHTYVIIFLLLFQIFLYFYFNEVTRWHGCKYKLFEMWLDGRKVRCRQILHYRDSGARRPIKPVIIITIPVNFASGRRDPLQAELNNDYLPRPINCHTTYDLSSDDSLLMASRQ